MLEIDRKTARSAWAYAAVFASVILMGAVVWVVRKTLLVFATALLFAYLLYPLVDFLDRRLPRRLRGFAVVLPFVLILSLVAGGAWYIKNPLGNEYLHLKANEHTLLAQAKAFTILDYPVGEHLVDALSSTEMMAVFPRLSGAVRTAGRYILNLFIIPILSFFILKDGRKIRASLLEMFANRRQAETFLEDAHGLLLEYMRALLLLCLSAGIAFTIVLTAMRLQYPILLGFTAFALEFVPLMGPLAAAVVILAVTHFTGYPHLWTVALFLVVYRLFQDYVLSPLLMKHSVKLYPLLVLFGVFAGAEIGGVAGVFLSIPVLALVRLIYYETTRRRTAAPERVVAALAHGAGELIAPGMPVA